jgi:hypothetical protein
VHWNRVRCHRNLALQSTITVIRWDCELSCRSPGQIGTTGERASGRTRAGADDRPDVLAAQRRGEAARREPVHDLYALEVARGRHDLEERAVERQRALGFARSAALVSQSNFACSPSGPLGSAV